MLVNQFVLFLEWVFLIVALVVSHCYIVPIYIFNTYFYMVYGGGNISVVVAFKNVVLYQERATFY